MRKSKDKVKEFPFGVFSNVNIALAEIDSFINRFGEFTKSHFTIQVCVIDKVISGNGSLGL